MSFPQQKSTWPLWSSLVLRPSVWYTHTPSSCWGSVNETIILVQHSFHQWNSSQIVLCKKYLGYRVGFWDPKSQLSVWSLWSTDQWCMLSSCLYLQSIKDPWVYEVAVYAQAIAADWQLVGWLQPSLYGLLAGWLRSQDKFVWFPCNCMSLQESSLACTIA